MSIQIERICFYRRIEAVRTCTHNICFYKENQKKYCSSPLLIFKGARVLISWIFYNSLSSYQVILKNITTQCGN